MKCSKDNKNCKIENKNFQISVIKKTLKINNTQIHSCEIDPTLHLDENIRLCKQKLHISKNNLDPKTKSMSKVERFLKAQEINDSRKNKNKGTDFYKSAKKTFEEKDLTKKNFKKWLKRPNRYDIRGVDNQIGY